MEILWYVKKKNSTDLNFEFQTPRRDVYYFYRSWVQYTFIVTLIKIKRKIKFKKN